MLPYGLVVGGAIVVGLLLMVLGAGSRSGSTVPGLSDRSPKAVRPGNARETAPEFSLARVGGDENATGEGLRGQVVVLHFWATWCPPCRAEFPEFARWAQGDGAREGVRVFAVSLDDSAETALTWGLRNGGGVGVWHDQKQLANALGVTVIPSTVLLDKQGRIAFFQEGAQDWSKDGVPQRVEDLRGE